MGKPLLAKKIPAPQILNHNPALCAVTSTVMLNNVLWIVM